MAVVDAAPLPVDVAIEGVQVCVAGQAVGHDADDLAARVRGTEVEYVVGLPGDGVETEVFFSDLGHEYIRINADYTTEDMAPLQPHGDIATLLEALPYIREFHGRTIVVKYGGAAMEDPSLREEFARDIVLLKYVGMNPIVVHGGGPEITHYMERLGLPVEFRGGLRVTERGGGRRRRRWSSSARSTPTSCTRIGRHGQAAVGLSGEDGDMLRRLAPHRARRQRRRLRREDRARRRGRHQPRRAGLHPRDRVDRLRPRRPEPQRQRRRGRRRGGAARSVPTRCCSSPTSRAGCAIRPTSPRSSARRPPTRSRRRWRASSGGMRPKLAGCVEAIHGGVSSAHIVDGRVPHSILLELFTDAGFGTKIRPSR